MSAKKRVIFCTYSSVYSSIVLEQLIKDSNIELVAVINSTRVLNSAFNPFQGAINQVKISGLRYSSYLFLVTDFFRWIQPILSFKKNSLRSLHTLANNNGIPIIDTRDINKPESIDFIIRNDPDFLLCAHFNQLLKTPVLGLKNIQFINIHPSLLPKYKGVDPVFFAMCDNAKEIGVTLHKINQYFDEGRILLNETLQINPQTSLYQHNCLLFERGTELALKWIKKDQNQLKSKILAIPKQEESYDSWPAREDIKKFKAAGNKLISFLDLWKLI